MALSRSLKINRKKETGVPGKEDKGKKPEVWSRLPFTICVFENTSDWKKRKEEKKSWFSREILLGFYRMGHILQGLTKWNQLTWPWCHAACLFCKIDGQGHDWQKMTINDQYSGISISCLIISKTLQSSPILSFKFLLENITMLLNLILLTTFIF